MKVTKHFLRLCAVICICSLLLPCAFAQELSADSEYEFTGTEFGEEAAANGVFITDTPEEDQCGLYLGSRLIRAGDFLPAQALEQLVLRPNRNEDAEVCIAYRPISDGTLGDAGTFSVQIASTRDDPPTAEDGKLETYRNIANEGTLTATDPEGQPVTFQIVSFPKRGTVELKENGTFVYTPKKNKVGEDSFTFTATDPAGNVSETKKVKINILKPVDAVTFSDLDADAQFTALWMRSSGLFGGETLAGQLCFCPEKTVTRGEFLVMAMKLADVPPEIGLLTSGFADQDTAPKWMQSYLVSAMRRGLISGMTAESGLHFEPNRPITGAEAASIVCSVCKLTPVQQVDSQDDTLPVWASVAMQTAGTAGIEMPDASSELTRLEAAKLLYSAAALLG